jgi:hypothetical protein
MTNLGLCLMPIADVTVEDTWFMVGMSEWKTQLDVHRRTVAPGRGPGIRGCVVPEGAQSGRRLRKRSAPRGEIMSPLPGATNGAP